MHEILEMLHEVLVVEVDAAHVDGDGLGTDAGVQFLAQQLADLFPDVFI